MWRMGGGTLLRITYRDLLRGRLPDDIVARLPRSFDLVGDIAIIRLDEDLIEYGPEIAEAIMRIHRRVRCVYARGPVQGTLRIQRLHHIGGERRTETIYRENGVLFSVDIASMYVNTRLSSERLKIAMEIIDNETVLDLFSGYGAYALNIARIRRASVIATDINRESIIHMVKSIYMNKLAGTVHPLVSDAESPPMRRGFDVVIADNPTDMDRYIETIAGLVRRGGRAYIYILVERPEDGVNKIERLSRGALRVSDLQRVREYSPRLNIYRYRAYRLE
jgi:tRNA (guanine37-N1)-methyltransferase